MAQLNIYADLTTEFGLSLLMKLWYFDTYSIPYPWSVITISFYGKRDAQLNHVFEKTNSANTIYSFQLIPSCFLLFFLGSWPPRLGISHLELQNYICLCALCYRIWPIYTNSSLRGHLNSDGTCPFLWWYMPRMLTGESKLTPQAQVYTDRLEDSGLTCTAAITGSWIYATKTGRQEREMTKSGSWIWTNCYFGTKAINSDAVYLQHGTFNDAIPISVGWRCSLVTVWLFLPLQMVNMGERKWGGFSDHGSNWPVSSRKNNPKPA